MNIFLAGSVVRFDWSHPCGGQYGVVKKDLRYTDRIVVELHDGTLITVDPMALTLVRSVRGRKDPEDAAHKMGMLQRELMNVAY